MKTLLLIGYLLFLILGAAVLGWLARWYKYGGRCGPDGLKDGIPNIDVEARTVTLDGSEPALAIDAKKTEAVKIASEKAAAAGESTRSALGTLKAGYAEGREAGTMPDAPGDDSTAARLAAVAGSVATKVETGLSSASETVKAKAARVTETAKSTVASVKGGFTEGKAEGDTPDAPADGSILAKVGAAVGGATAAVGAGAAKATESVKGAVSGAGDSASPAAASVKDGFAEGKAEGDTPDAPADGSILAKVGAAVGGATAAVGAGAAKATESVKGAVSGAGDSATSAAASVKDGFTEGKAEGDTPDAPADGSILAKAGAAVGGATAAVGAGAAKATESVKGAVSGAGDSATSAAASVKDGFAEGKAEGDTPDAPADGSILAKVGAAVGGATAAVGAGAAKATESVKGAVGATDGTENTGGVDQRSRELAGRAGATLGQEDGYAADEEDGLSGSGPMRARFAALSDEAERDSGDASGMDAGVIEIPETLSEAEVEAERLIAEGGEVSAPESSLAAPHADRAPDDLKLISGVGPKIEGTLNEKGIFYFDQIAGFGGRDLAWADQTLGFKGRVVRDRWVPQAKALAEQRARHGIGTTIPERAETDAGAAPINAPLRIVEAEALRLIEQEGGYKSVAATRPDMLMKSRPEGGKVDDLRRIRGIGDKLQGTLNGIGVYTFEQIAGMTAKDIAWVDSKLNFKGRIIRDRWVPQAEIFARGGDI